MSRTWASVALDTATLGLPRSSPASRSSLKTPQPPKLQKWHTQYDIFKEFMRVIMVIVMWRTMCWSGWKDRQRHDREEGEGKEREKKLNNKK